jgi:hypothetical protein
VDVYGGTNIAVVHNRDSNITTRTYNSSGTLLWSADHGGTAMYDVVVDSNNNIFTAGIRTSNVVFRKYNSSGVEQNTRDYSSGNNPFRMTFDSSDNLYVSFLRSSTITSQIIKYSNDLSTTTTFATLDPLNSVVNYRGIFFEK